MANSTAIRRCKYVAAATDMAMNRQPSHAILPRIWRARLRLLHAPACLPACATIPFSDCITRSDAGPIPTAIEAVGFDSLAVRPTFERQPRSHRFRQWHLLTSSKRAGARLGLDAAPL